MHHPPKSRGGRCRNRRLLFVTYSLLTSNSQEGPGLTSVTHKLLLRWRFTCVTHIFAPFFVCLLTFFCFCFLFVLQSVTTRLYLSRIWIQDRHHGVRWCSWGEKKKFYVKTNTPRNSSKTQGKNKERSLCCKPLRIALHRNVNLGVISTNLSPKREPCPEGVALRPFSSHRRATVFSALHFPPKNGKVKVFKYWYRTKNCFYE